MRSSEYGEILNRLGLTHVGAGCMFGINHRTSRKYALGERRVPRAVAIVLQLMLDLAISEEEIRAVTTAPVDRTRPVLQAIAERDLGRLV
jgi:hypothetical protein